MVLNKTLQRQIGGVQNKLKVNKEIREDVLGKKLKEFMQEHRDFKETLVQLLTKR